MMTRNKLEVLNVVSMNDLAASFADPARLAQLAQHDMLIQVTPNKDLSSNDPSIVLDASSHKLNYQGTLSLNKMPSRGVDLMALLSPIPTSSI